MSFLDSHRDVERKSMTVCTLAPRIVDCSSNRGPNEPQSSGNMRNLVGTLAALVRCNAAGAATTKREGASTMKKIETKEKEESKELQLKVTKVRTGVKAGNWCPRAAL